MLTHSPSASPARPGRCWRHIVVGVLAVLTAGASFVYGPRLGGIFARQVASVGSHLRIRPGEMVVGLVRLARPRRLPRGLARSSLSPSIAADGVLEERPGRGETQGRTAPCVTSGLKLDSFRRGGLRRVAETEMGDLATAGVPLSDITSTFLCGYLANNDAAGPRLFLEKITERFPDEVHREYLWGAFLAQARRPRQCRNPARGNALHLQPGHKLAQ